MPTLTKESIIDHLVVENRMQRRQAREVLESLLALMKKSLVDDGHLMISGFGVFEVAHKAERLGRNPYTGDRLLLAARNVVTFRISRKFRNQLNDENPGN